MISENIKCPHCNYGGEDLKIGRTMPDLRIGYMIMICSACKKEFRIKIVYECY